MLKIFNIDNIENVTAKPWAKIANGNNGATVAAIN